jgi:ketosteroid isomerase-like protein
MAIDTQRLKDVFEKWDLAALKELYAEDFEQTEMDDVTPPNEPRKRTKQDLIEIVERNQSGSKVKLAVDNLFATDDHVAYTVTCTLPDGRRVVGNSILDIRDDKIIRETTVQAREPE